MSGGRRVTADGGGLNFYTTSVTEELQAQEKSFNQSIKSYFRQGIPMEKKLIMMIDDDDMIWPQCLSCMIISNAMMQ